MGKGSNSTSQTQTTSVDPTAYAAYQKLIGQAESTASTPWNPNTAQQVAGFTGDQLDAFGQVRGGISQPYINQAAQFATSGAGPVSQTMQQYYNPFQQGVIDSSLRDIDTAAARENSGLTGNMRRNGSLGGDREAVALELARERQGDARNQVITGLNAQNYNQALAAGQNDAGRALTGAGIMGNLGQLAYTDTNALLGIGGAQQQQQQREFDAASGNAAAQSAHPFQTQQWMAGILGSATPNLGSTTTGTKTPPQPNTWSQIAGAGLAALPYLGVWTGGRIGRAAGGSIGYVPQFQPQGGGGIQAPQLNMGGDQKQKGFADHFKEIQDTAKGYGAAATGISGAADKVGNWMRTESNPSVPGGWGNTTTTYADPMQNFGYGMSNTFSGIGDAIGGMFGGFADGGAIDDNTYRVSDQFDPGGIYGGPVEAMPINGGILPKPFAMPGSDDIARPPLMRQAMEGVRAPGPSAPVADVASEVIPSSSRGAPPTAGDPYAPPPLQVLNPRAGGIGAMPMPSSPPPAQSREGISGIMDSISGLGNRFDDWRKSGAGQQFLTNAGYAMMAGSGVGGKGSFGMHLGSGLQAGAEAERNYEKGQREQLIEKGKMELANKAHALRVNADNREATMAPYERARVSAQTDLAKAQAAAKEDPMQKYKTQAAIAKSLGMDPNSQEYKEYMLNGKIGKDDVSPTAQKQILESVESNAGVPLARQYVKEALELNKKATEGAIGRFYSQNIDPNLPESLRSDTAQATRSLDRTMMGNVLGKLKETFGAAPTEGERKILVDLETAMSQTAKDRDGILQRALAELDKREKLNTMMLDQLRGKTMFKPQQPGAAPPPATATPDPLGLR